MPQQALIEVHRLFKYSLPTLVCILIFNESYTAGKSRRWPNILTTPPGAPPLKEFVYRLFLIKEIEFFALFR